MRRLVPIALALACLPARAQDVNVVDVGERTPLAYVLVTPTGAPARTRSSELIRLLDDAARRLTSLALRPADDALAQGCRGRLLCMVLRLRPDYDRDYLRDGSRVRPYAEHLRDLAERGVSYPKSFLLITNVTREGEPDRLSAQLIDTNTALGLYHQASRDDDYWEAGVEASINEAAPSSPRTEVADMTAAEQFVESLFRDHLRPILETNGQWEPYGHIELPATLPGLTLTLDDQPIGVTTRAPTRLDGILPGHRRLELTGAAIAPFRAEVPVAPGKTSAVAPELVLAASTEEHAAHLGLELGGAAVAAAGLVVTVLAAATPDGDVRTYCVRGAVEGCESARPFVTTGYDASGGTLVNGPGVPLLPLGLGLLAGGATWGLGALLTDDADIPWIPLAAGVALGVATYAVSAAAGPAAFEAQ